MQLNVNDTMLYIIYLCPFSLLFCNVYTFLVCYEGDIRLLGGPTVAQGTVELCIRNQYAAICGQYWTANDSKVVCRQLGFNNSELSLGVLALCE